VVVVVVVVVVPVVYRRLILQALLHSLQGALALPLGVVAEASAGRAVAFLR